MRVVTAHPGGGLKIEDRDEPRCEPGRVRVRIAYAGICGSDLHYAKAGKNGVFTIEAPVVLGHEVVGVVDQLGEGVDPSLLGQRAAIHPASPAPVRGSAEAVGCNIAYGIRYLGSAASQPHTDGGFADYLIVDEAQLYELPPGLPLRLAALAEPLGVAMHGVRRAAPESLSGRVLVAGVGPIGALVIAALVNEGATDITATDLTENALRLAREVGATKTVQLGADPLPEAEEFDVIFESSGSVRSLASALSWVKRGGTIVQVGMLPDGELSVPLSPLVNKEISLLGTQRFDVEFEDAIDLLDRTPALEAVISHVFAAEEAVDAFETAADSTRSSKVMLRFAEDVS